MPDTLRKFAWGPCLGAAHVSTCTHMHRLKLSQSCLSNSQTRASMGPGGRGGPPCHRKLEGTPDNPSLQAQAAQETTRDRPCQQPREGPPDSWAPEIPWPVLTLQQRPKEKSFPGCSCHICLGGRRHSGAAPDPKIPSQPVGPEGRFSHWQPRVKHEDCTVPEGC